MRPPGPRTSGLVAIAALAVAYPWFAPHVGRPLAVFALPPLVVAGIAAPTVVLQVAVAAVVVAVVEGALGSGLSAPALAARCVIVVVASVVSVWVATARARRDRALLEATAARDALSERLRSVTSSLHAGRLGTWQWDAALGTVEWDEDLARLFGRTLAEFPGTFEGWLALVHPEDRAQCEAVVERAVRAPSPFVFEHRCVWPDGSVHWLEGAGEPVFSDTGALVGAVGVTTAIDDRRAADEERTRLLLVERRSRERSDYLARAAQIVGTSLDLDALTAQIVEAPVHGLADWCRLTLLLEDLDPIVRTAAAHVDADIAATVAELQARYPFDPRAEMGMARVMRTHRTIHHFDISPELLRQAFDEPGYAELLVRLDLRSAVVVPIRSSSGVVGALQLVRTSSKPRFEPADVEVAEELAAIIGIAVENAVNYERQRRARRALDVLQRLSGRLALALTATDIVDAVIEEGTVGLAADGAMLYLVEDEVLHLVGHTGYPEERLHAWRALAPGTRTPAAEAYRESRTVTIADHADLVAHFPELAPLSPFDQAIIAIPLAVRQVSFGTMLFSFRRPRRILAEEATMLETFAARCAGALERAGLYERQRAASLLLQRRMLPELPTLPGWLDAAAHYQPATGGEVGGDWYQLLVLADDLCAAVLGDAVGRGVPAAAAMGQLRGVITGAASVDPSPARVVLVADRFAAQGADTVATSLSYALIDRGRGVIRYASAGHLPGLLRRADGAVEVLVHGRGPLLGIRAPFDEPAVAEVPFGPGDSLVLYSDGLVERRHEVIDDGVARLRDALACAPDLDAAALRSHLVTALVDPDELDDDVALFVVRCVA